MHFVAVTLSRFRNLWEVRLSLGKGVFVLLGENAQGKTNFLEALFLLARGFSPFAFRDEELIFFGAEAASLSARFAEGNAVLTRQVLLRKNGKREWRLDGKPERKRLALPLVGFFPEDLALVEGEPKKRRDFVDQAVCFLSPSFAALLGKYERILTQRNLLLREKGDRGLVHVYGEQLVALGVRIVEERLRYLRLFAPFLSQAYQRVSGGGESLRVVYEPKGYGLTQGVREGLERALRELEGEEWERGMTLFGPHRDEVSFLLGDRDVREFSSFGERKSVALALRMAEKAVVQWIRKDGVVLLLDDAFPGLDARRRALLASCVFSEDQAFLTTTEEDIARELEKRGARVLQVCGGKIQDA
ncbi:MAG: DNA replication and repair protein RecF [Atribacterota bacterium]